jgi:hypothetical protein
MSTEKWKLGRVGGHTEHAQDGDQIEIYLESRPPEDFRVRRPYLLTVIPTQAWDVRVGLLVKCT